MPVNPYDDPKVSLRRPHGNGDLDIVRASYTRHKANHTQGAKVTGQLRVNGKIRHLQRRTLEHQSLALKRKHRVHKYVNIADIYVSVMNLFILT